VIEFITNDPAEEFAVADTVTALDELVAAVVLKVDALPRYVEERMSR
jgi:hypothetical protein